jgi:hypothetical protein
VSPFTWDRFDDATRPLVYADAWKVLKPTIIVHDVGHTKDRSTAVVGGKSMLAPGLKLLERFDELPQGLLGSARAEALAAVDRLYGGKTLIFVDVTFDPTYAETVLERFGPERVIGVRITSSGDGMTVDFWPTKAGGFASTLLAGVTCSICCFASCTITPCVCLMGRRAGAPMSS